MKTPSLIKNAIYSALVFFGTLFVLSVGYATFTALQSSDAGPGKSLTSTMMQTVIGNLSDLDSRVSGVTTSLSTLSGAVSSLQSVTGGIWSSGGGSIYYNTGNVGIGATNPNSLLHIYKSSGNNAEIDIQSVAGALKHWGIYQDRASESLRFWNSTAGGDLTTFTNDGKVGIGTSSPSTKLEVAGEVKSTNLTLTDTNSQSTSLGALRITGTNGAIVLDDGGQKRISWNDAGGNFNIRSGNYYQTGVGVSYAKGILDNNGGAAVISMGSDGNDGAISLKTAPIGTPGNLITWGNQFTLGTGYTLFDMSTATGAYFYVK